MAWQHTKHIKLSEVRVGGPDVIDSWIHEETLDQVRIVAWKDRGWKYRVESSVGDDWLRFDSRKKARDYAVELKNEIG